MDINYISDENGKKLWIRSRSGVPVTLTTSKSTIIVADNWLEINLNSELYALVSKLNKLVAVTDVNPIQETPNTKILEKLNVSESKIDLVVGDKKDLVITAEPDIPLPSQLISISEHLNIASTEVVDMTITVKAHKPGSTVLIHRSGNVECSTTVNVYPEPMFVKQYFETEVGVPVTLAITGQSEFTLTCPDGIHQSGNTVIADEPGTYDVLASILGRTISATIKAVGNPKLEESEQEPEAPIEDNPSADETPIVEDSEEESEE